MVLHTRGRVGRRLFNRKPRIVFIRFGASSSAMRKDTNTEYKRFIADNMQYRKEALEENRRFIHTSRNIGTLKSSNLWAGSLETYFV